MTIESALFFTLPIRRKSRVQKMLKEWDVNGCSVPQCRPHSELANFLFVLWNLNLILFCQIWLPQWVNYYWMLCIRIVGNRLLFRIVVAIWWANSTCSFDYIYIFVQLLLPSSGLAAELRLLRDVNLKPRNLLWQPGLTYIRPFFLNFKGLLHSYNGWYLCL